MAHYVSLGDKDEAMNWLEKASQNDLTQAC
jgi:hypothetical protein